MSVREFLRNYWQKRPLLIRGAIPGFEPLVSLEDLRSLAARDDVESRVVSAFQGRWKLAHGPFTHLPRSKRDWTLLVSGVNLYKPAVDAFLQRFAFLPYTRLDDVMVSYAVSGGSVGPHYDSYDVFLVQAQGRRRWRVGAQQDLSLVEDLPLKVLKNFEPSHEWLVETGDILYLPPHIAHEGVALQPCTTYSVGFRAPAYSELAREFLYSLADTIDLPGRYQDPSRVPSSHPAHLEDRMLRELREQLSRIRWNASDVSRFAGRYFSEPKAHVYFDAPKRMTPARFMAMVGRSGLKVDARTRLIYRGSDIFINGEVCAFGQGEHTWLADFANQRYASPSQCRVGLAHSELKEALYEWYCAGWIIMGAPIRDKT
jgi:50S ribosomal protein L16 3-hydroxylase